jgi:hypothetical protein
MYYYRLFNVGILSLSLPPIQLPGSQKMRWWGGKLVVCMLVAWARVSLPSKDASVTRCCMPSSETAFILHAPSTAERRTVNEFTPMCPSWRRGWKARLPNTHIWALRMAGDEKTRPSLRISMTTCRTRDKTLSGRFSRFLGKVAASIVLWGSPIRVISPVDASSFSREHSLQSGNVKSNTACDHKRGVFYLQKSMLAKSILRNQAYQELYANSAERKSLTSAGGEEKKGGEDGKFWKEVKQEHDEKRVSGNVAAYATL